MFFISNDTVLDDWSMRSLAYFVFLDLFVGFYLIRNAL